MSVRETSNEELQCFLQGRLWRVFGSQRERLQQHEPNPNTYSLCRGIEGVYLERRKSCGVGVFQVVVYGFTLAGSDQIYRIVGSLSCC